MKLKVWYGKEWEPDTKQTYVLVKEIIVDNLEKGFEMMQAENWSPNGEAMKLISGLGLHHTSMSVGDAFEDENGNYFVVGMFGFTPLSTLPNKTKRF